LCAKQAGKSRLPPEQGPVFDEEIFVSNNATHNEMLEVIEATSSYRIDTLSAATY